jgi:hypothetical protein
VKRPTWAAAGSFASAYSAAERSLGEQMAEARVICIPKEQAEVLPNTESFARPPFDKIYFDFGGIRFGPAHELVGALVWNIADRMKPEDRSTYEADPILRPYIDKPASFVMYPFGRSVGRRVMSPAAAITVFDEGETEFDYPIFQAPPVAGNSSLEEAAERLARWQASRIEACLQWLQSFNVEVVETPLSPRQREREIKKGRQIALTVEVKQSKRYTSRRRSNGKANYSHRFETRGRYNHHFEEKADGTPNKVFAACLRKNPSRLVTVDGKRCFKFWQPPFVTGPVDKPLVPKVRVAAETPKAA